MGPDWPGHLGVFLLRGVAFPWVGASPSPAPWHSRGVTRRSGLGGDGTNDLPPRGPGEGLVPLHQRASHPTRELDYGVGTP